MSSFTWQMLTRHRCVPCLPLSLRNTTQPLLSRSSQVMGELSMQIIPVGLAKHFSRNMLRVQYKLGRRAITLEGELRTSFSELLSCFKRWVECSGEAGRGHAVQCLHLVPLGWIPQLEGSLKQPDCTEPWMLRSIIWPTCVWKSGGWTLSWRLWGATAQFIS